MLGLYAFSNLLYRDYFPFLCLNLSIFFYTAWLKLAVVLMNMFSFDSILYLFKQKKLFAVLFYVSEIYCLTLKLSFDLKKDSVSIDV
jgi:hypothetical protein